MAKEHRPNPIVQMGLFMDGDGMPLAFDLFAGNQNEQPSLKPIEKRLIKDFHLSKFVVCTDAGLSSNANRRFNNMKQRGFITTQSIKKLKQIDKTWALDPTGWRILNGTTDIDLRAIDEEKHLNTIFYKERWIKEDTSPKQQAPLEQRLIVTYSPKYARYQQSIREEQIQRAMKRLDNEGALKRRSPNDSHRFIKVTHATNEGEVASHALYDIDTQ